MKFSSSMRRLGVLAIFLAAAFLLSPSFRGDKLQSAAGAPIAHSGSILILQADGGAPPPPPPPPPIKLNQNFWNTPLDHSTSTAVLLADGGAPPPPPVPPPLQKTGSASLA